VRGFGFGFAGLAARRSQVQGSASVIKISRHVAKLRTGLLRVPAGGSAHRRSALARHAYHGGHAL
jgi:hypothetical protein